MKTERADGDDIDQQNDVDRGGQHIAEPEVRADDRPQQASQPVEQDTR